MRPYGKISTRLWTSQKFRNLSPYSKLFYMYLHTCAHCNSIGCFTLRKGYMQADLNWTDTRIDTCMIELSKELISYDKDAEVIRIHNFLNHSPVQNEKHAKGICKIILDIPNCKEKTIVYNELCNDNRFKDNFDHTSIDTSMDSGINTGIDTTSTNTITKTSTKTMPVSFSFDDFYEKYPIKKSKAPAKKVFDKVCKTDEMFETIMQGLEGFNYWIRKTNQDLDFVKHPSTWLNKECWNDEYGYKPIANQNIDHEANAEFMKQLEAQGKPSNA